MAALLTIVERLSATITYTVPSGVQFIGAVNGNGILVINGNTIIKLNGGIVKPVVANSGDVISNGDGIQTLSIDGILFPTTFPAIALQLLAAGPYTVPANSLFIGWAGWLNSSSANPPVYVNGVSVVDNLTSLVTTSYGVGKPIIAAAGQVISTPNSGGVIGLNGLLFPN